MEDWLKCQISPLVKYRQNILDVRPTLYVQAVLLNGVQRN